MQYMILFMDLGPQVILDAVDRVFRTPRTWNYIQGTLQMQMKQTLQCNSEEMKRLNPTFCPIHQTGKEWGIKWRLQVLVYYKTIPALFICSHELCYLVYFFFLNYVLW